MSRSLRREAGEVVTLCTTSLRYNTSTPITVSDLTDDELRALRASIASELLARRCNQGERR